jgi:nucleoid-associated protein YgaU
MVTINEAGGDSGATQSRADYAPQATSRPGPPPQSPPKAAKPQENAALQPAPAVPASSASKKGSSSQVAAPKGLTRVVSRGDSLWRISRITYGDGTRYAIVYRANQDRIRDPNLIHPGQILLVPMKRN